MVNPQCDNLTQGGGVRSPQRVLIEGTPYLRLPFEAGNRRFGRAGVALKLSKAADKTTLVHVPISNLSTEDDGMVFATLEADAYLGVVSQHGLSAFFLDFQGLDALPGAVRTKALTSGETVTIARLIAGATDRHKERVVYRNGDRFDLRRSNLAIVKRGHKA